jgi:hypothetical protein
MPSCAVIFAQERPSFAGGFSLVPKYRLPALNWNPESSSVGLQGRRVISLNFHA